MDTCNQTKQITIYSYDLLSTHAQQIAVENFRSNEENFKRFESDLRVEYLDEIFEELKVYGLYIHGYTYKLNIYDGGAYTAHIDLKKLLATDTEKLKQLFPAEFYDVKKDYILTNEIEPLYQSDPFYLGIEYFCPGIFKKGTVKVITLDNTPVQQSWVDAIQYYIESAYRPLNRGMHKDVQDRYNYSRSVAAIEDYFTTNYIMFTRTGKPIMPPDCIG